MATLGSMTTVTIRPEETPNPNARRYVLDRPVQEQAKGRFFTSSDQSDEPLVSALFDISGVTGVMLLPTSVTVNKSEAASWDDVDEAARSAIESYFA